MSGKEVWSWITKNRISDLPEEHLPEDRKVIYCQQCKDAAFLMRTSNGTLVCSNCFSVHRQSYEPMVYQEGIIKRWERIEQVLELERLYVL